MGKVLVVDDDSHIVSLLQRVVLKKGHQILVAGNGRQGLALARSEVPDIVLTDIRMPDMQGGELAMAIKNDPNLAHITVIIMSGEIYENPLVDRVLVKPFDLHEVYELLDDYLGSAPTSSPRP